MKLYDDCLIYFLKKNICTDALPSTIQDDIFALKFFYQLTRRWTEKAAILEYCTFSHSLWWEDKLENLGNWLYFIRASCGYMSHVCMKTLIRGSCDNMSHPK